MGKDKSENAPSEQEDRYARENNGSWWVLETRVPKEEARVRWPDRLIAGLDCQQTLCEEEDRKVAEAHFEAIKVEDVGVVRLGSCVEVGSSEHAGHNMIATVVELYEDPKGERWMDIAWFYKQFDTSLKCMDKDGKYTLPMELDAKMLFKANGTDNKKYSTVLSINTINRLVDVVYRVPGGEKPQECDFYWSMFHDQRHNTFTDSFEEAPPSLALHAASKGPRVLNTLELYCGCGGLSFADRHTQDVIIETKWAVDYERPMIETFKANYPYAHGHIIGADEFLELCKHWKRMTDKFHMGWKALKPKALQTALYKKNGRDVGCQKEVAEIISMTIVDKGTKGKTGQGKGHQLSGLKAGDTWLMFGVVFKGEEGMHWVREEALSCDNLLAPFVQKMRASGYIPLPGDVDIIMGGPPCQGVSGLNRHGKTKEIIDDPRNRQVLAFYKTIEWFQPSYVLMENVLDIFKKGDGLYAKMAATTLLNLDYQTRTGVIAAAHHGCPQGRWRAFMWGAKSGKEQLPPFPEPTFAAGFACGVPRAATECVVGFQSVEAFDKAHQMTFLGDILSDLPDVSNFAVSDRSAYESDPMTPMQHYLRRDPPEWAGDRYTRAERAVNAMASTQEDMAFRIKSLAHLTNPPLAVGASYLCSKGTLGENELVGNRTDMFAAEIVRSTGQLLAAEDKTLAAAYKLTLELAKASLSQRVGEEVLEQNGYRNRAYDADSDDEKEPGSADWVRDEPEDFTAVNGDLSDHRPLTLNADDFLRCVNVPDEKAANYRDFPGVLSHRDETCCSGSTHAATYVSAKNAKVTACQGGGTRTVTKGGNHAACRVDHADNGGWRGPFLPGCSAFTRLMPTGDLLCPRWCITYKKGKSEGRHGCYGRMWFDEIQSTIVGRAEPHNLRLVHPWQHRVATIRENARCQGFPDYFTFVGIGPTKSTNPSWVRNTSLTIRYQQLGNAVSPLVADALGRCLAQAAVGKAPMGAFVICSPSPELDRAYQEARQKGLKTYVEHKGIPQAYARHIMKMRKAAEDLRALGMAEALKVLNEGVEDTASEDPVTVEEDAEDDCRDDVKQPPPKRRKKAAGAERAPKRKAEASLASEASGTRKAKAKK